MASIDGARGWGVRLCADDFGLSEAVNDGVLELIAAGRLDAVSCMAGGAAFAGGAPALLDALRAAPHRVEIGLHVTLTELAPLGPMVSTAPDGRLPGIARLMVSGLRGRLALTEIAAEIARQARRFRRLIGRAPEFLDGHQHAHLVPGLWRALLASRPAWAAAEPWVRSCRCPATDLARLPSDRAKAGLLTALSSRHPLLGQIRTNPWFYGVNDFRTDRDFAPLMERWLALAAARPEGALIMVHPGAETAATSEPPDPIAARRPQEFAYLASEAFADRLERLRGPPQAPP